MVQKMVRRMAEMKVGMMVAYLGETTAGLMAAEMVLGMAVLMVATLGRWLVDNSAE